MKLIFLFLFLFIAGSCAKTLYISAETGALTETPPVPDPVLNGMKRVQRGVATVTALWVDNPSWHTNSPLCSESVDAYLNQQNEKLMIPQWAIFPQYGADQGSAEILIEIDDLETFVSYAFTQGVWLVPDDCQSIWDQILKKVVVPLINSINTQDYPTLTARANGLTIALMCKPVDAADWSKCTPDEYHAITHANVNIHNPKLREYKKVY